MTPKTLDFKCALITGGSGGIGRALAEWFISQGKQVIIAGRTESNLAAAAKEMGNNTAYYVLDTGVITDIAPFVQKLIKEHPEVDALVSNAGVQMPLNINDFDLAKADSEIDINVRGPMHLTINLLPHFKAKPGGGVVINVSSVLGYIPMSIINPVYNGTKAWVHFWTKALRTQLHHENVKVVEIAPPTVATDLHREREDPDDNKKDKNPNTLTVEEFMDYVAKGLENGEETISAGVGVDIVKRWDATFGGQFDKSATAYLGAE